MMYRGSTLGLVFALGLVWAGGASAQLPLYAAATGEIDGSGPSTLYALDPLDATATEIGPIEGPDPDGEGTLQYERVDGLAFLRDGRLVAAASGDALLDAGRGSVLIEIDPASGGATFIGFIDDDESGICGRISDISAEPATGELFGIADFCTNDEDRLYEIDPVTGQGSSIGVIDGETRMGNGLAAEPASGTLFATRTRIQTFPEGPERLRVELVSLDPGTGEGTPEGPGFDFGTLGGLDFQPLEGVLYGVGIEEEEVEPDMFELVPVLVTVNTGTGRPTRIGVTTIDGEDLFGVDAIAFPTPGGCPASTSTSCFGPGKSSLSYKTSSGKLRWKWRRGGFGSESLGDPTVDTGYRVCLYDGAGARPVIAAGAAVPAGEGWKSKKKGFKYKNKSGAPDGITSLELKTGSDRAKLSVKGKGVAAPLLPLLQSPSVVIEVQNELGSCWQGLYGRPARKNDAEGFEDKFK